MTSSTGALYNPPLRTDRFAAEQRSRIILVHGFANSEDEAIESYKKFQSSFQRYNNTFSSNVFHLTWPGDHVTKKLWKYFDFNVQTALDAGKILARYLISLIEGEKIACTYTIVAHSLGCRLTAAMMKELREHNEQICRRFKLILMAGAVPVDDVKSRATFGDGLGSAAYVMNLFSPKDEVLGGWRGYRITSLFRLGELGGGRSPSEPIGLNGQPDTFRWSDRRNMGIGHTEYWIRSETAEVLAKVLNVPVDTTLQYLVPPTHVLAEHQLAHGALDELAPEARSLG